ncbi:MAG TPA: DUF2064 domain-containing protein [Gemmatimonadales bacterium]
MRPALALLVDRPDAGAGLAAEIGMPHALRLERLLVARALASARSAGLPATVWFRPPDARAAMRQWLGEEVDLRPQGSGPLGGRIAAAVAGAVLPSGWLVLLRLVPDLDASLAFAIAALEDVPYVLGPTTDGGCYLVGGRAPVFAALRDLVSPGAGALDALRTGLRAGRHEWRECAVLRAIERAADARAARLLV